MVRTQSAKAYSSSYSQVILVYLQPFWRNSLVMRVAARNREKFTETRYFGGSRSFKVVDVDISKKLDASACMISSMSMPICNHFHVRRAYDGKNNAFKGGSPLSPPRSIGSPLPSGMKFCHEILERIGYHMVKTQNLYLTWSWFGTGS